MTKRLISLMLAVLMLAFAFTSCGDDEDALNNAVNEAANGNMSSLINSLDADSRAQLNAALRDKEKAREILNSDAARAIINSLLGGKNNG